MIKKLDMSLGAESSKAIQQISKDLKLATEALKKIPAKEMKSWELYLPFSFLVPHTFGIGSVISLKKGSDLARRGYGYLLSSPARVKQYDNALKAIIRNDKEAYLKATKIIVDGEEED